MKKFMKQFVPPEVYPLVVIIAMPLSFAAVSCVWHMTTDPAVRFRKDDRAAGVLENHEEGKKFAENAVKRFCKGRSAEVMPGINKYFSRDR